MPLPGACARRNPAGRILDALEKKYKRQIKPEESSDHVIIRLLAADHPACMARPEAAAARRLTVAGATQGGARAA
jgi:hypothetical protein